MSVFNAPPVVETSMYAIRSVIPGLAAAVADTEALPVPLSGVAVIQLAEGVAVQAKPVLTLKLAELPTADPSRKVSGVVTKPVVIVSWITIIVSVNPLIASANATYENNLELLMFAEFVVRFKVVIPVPVF